MEVRLTELRYREVINISDGTRLGFVNDAILDLTSGRILALIVPGPARFFGLFGRESDYILPWESIARIGGDIVLIDGAGMRPPDGDSAPCWSTPLRRYNDIWLLSFELCDGEVESVVIGETKKFIPQVSLQREHNVL